MDRIVSLIAGALVLWASYPGLAGDAAAGQSKAMACAACHGANGVSVMPNYPNLAGQKEQYMAKQLQDFKAGRRTDPTMIGMVAALSDKDIQDLTAYFSGLPAGK